MTDDGADGEQRDGLDTVLEPRPWEAAVGCLGIGEVLDRGL